MNNLALLTGADIPFKEGKLLIHQPTLKEIAMIGEDDFFIGCGLLTISKNILNSQDKIDLDKINDFNIFMSIINGTMGIDKNLQKNIDCAFNVLYLLFPTLDIKAEKDKLIIGEGYIDKTNFSEFKNILKTIFNLSFKDSEVQKDYKPATNKAQQIAEKLKKRHQDLIARSGVAANGKEVRIFGRYMSIISVYNGISFKDLEQYTVFQLYDIFKRVQLKIAYDMAMRAKLVGAKDVKNPDDWMKDIYEMK